MEKTLLLAFAFVGLASCAATDAWPTSGKAPTPYTAAEIREAHPDGTMLRFAVQAGPRAPEIIQVMRFDQSDAEGVNVESWTEDLRGTRLGDATRARATWDELRDHAAYDAVLAAREPSHCVVVAGDYDCWLYTVQSASTDSGAVERYWFAHTKPGPPVLLVREQGGLEVLRMELLEYRRGG